MSEPAEPAPRELPFEFRGDAREYFAIWIVNLALTLLTFGIFSAWAKVRRERYFYGNTWIDGTPFQYRASPLNVLRGRLIAVALLVIYIVLSQTVPGAELVLLLLLFVATPWIVVNGLRFRARYSEFAAIAFRFDARTRDAWVPYFWLFLLVLPTLGLIYPYGRYRQWRFVVDRHAYGDTRFSFAATVGDFMFIYIVASLVVGVAVAGAGLTLGGLIAATGAQTDVETALYGVFGVVGLFYLAAFFGWTYTTVQVTNLVFNTSRLGAHAFRSTLRTKDLAWILLSNTVAVLVSLGLLVPWAQIRLARYRAANMHLLAQGDLGALTGRAGAAQSATGAEAADVFDVDLSL